MLVSRHGRTVARLSEEVDGFTAKNVLLRLHAAAEVSAAHETSFQEAVFEHVKAMVRAGMWKAHAYFEHISYDETSLEVRSYYQTDDIDKEVAKVFVLEHGWSMVVERLNWSANSSQIQEGTGSFAVLEGSSTPSIRVSKSASGVFTAAVLRTGPQPPPGIHETFDFCVRLAETDEGPSNPVAEAVIMKDRAISTYRDQPWCHAYILCLAHKAHACTTKLWSLQEDTLSVIVHTCKTLSAAGSWSTLREAATALLLRRFVRITDGSGSTDDAAHAFRNLLTRFFLPSSSMPRRRSTLVAALAFFNGDLRKETVSHICSNCCMNEAASREKAAFFFRKLFQAIRPRMFAKNNWVEWAESFVFFGIADGFHHVIVDAFQAAFTGKDTLGTGEPAEREVLFDFPDTSEGLGGQVPQPHVSEEDAQQRAREENARSLRVSLGGFQRGLWGHIILMRVPLEPARLLMRFLTHSISQEWEEQQMKKMWEMGSREFRAQLLHQGDILPAFFRSTLSQFKDIDLWREFGQTEEFRSRLLRFSFRPGAVAHQLIRIRVQSLPYRLLTLLDTGADVIEQAEMVLRTPACMKDSFSAKFLAKFHTPHLLLSEAAQNILWIFARRARCSTYPTERLHSRNLRRAKCRVETQRVSVKDLALPHSGLTGATFALSDAMQQEKTHTSQKRRIGRPPKRPEADPQNLPPPKRRQAGAGGAWRAFLHHRLAGQRFTSEMMLDAKEAYHRLSVEDRAYYAELGRAGDGEERCGCLGLGPSSGDYKIKNTANEANFFSQPKKISAQRLAWRVSASALTRDGSVSA